MDILVGDDRVVAQWLGKPWDAVQDDALTKETIEPGRRPACAKGQSAMRGIWSSARQQMIAGLYYTHK